MAKETEQGPVPMVSDEEREYAGAVHEALTGAGKFPAGHEYAGLTKQEMIDHVNEERQHPQSDKKPGKAPVVRVGEVQGATGAGQKKDAAASKK